MLTDVTATMDTHFAFQIFFPSFWVDRDDRPLAPFREITTDDIDRGDVRPNPAVAGWLCDGNYAWLLAQARHYCAELEKAGKYRLYLWPPHCILGSDGHALVGVIHEARMFHAFVRGAQSWVEVKGGNPLTENYSVLRPEVLTRHDGQPLGQKNTAFIQTLLEADAVVIAGQAASHCVKSSIDDLLRGDRGAGHGARAQGVPARRLHVGGHRPGRQGRVRRGLHPSGGRGAQAVRRRRHARRPLDGSDRNLAWNAPGDAMKTVITLVRGDGIGPEVVDGAVRAIEATGAEIEWEARDAGASAIPKHGAPLPEETLESIRRTRLCLKGPLTTPIGGGYSSINVALRREFDLFANVRPARTFAGLPGRYDKVDLVVVRENTQGEYRASSTTSTRRAAPPRRSRSSRGTDATASFALRSNTRAPTGASWSRSCTRRTSSR